MALTWDVWNQLASAGGATYTYDSAGRRISKTVNGVSTFYLYDGDALIAELDSQGNITRTYTWGALGLISDRIPGQSGPLTRFYRFDPVGNTRFLLNAYGQILEQAAYNSWGSALSPTYPSTPFCWKGRFGLYRDTESGLFLTQARYYTPALGRFISRDPSGFSAGPNLYAYCAGDPVNFCDLNGCDPTNDIDPSALGNLLGGAVDKVTGGDLVGSATNSGRAEGLNDAHKISAKELMKARMNYAAQLAGAAMAIDGFGKGLSGVEEAEEAEAETEEECDGPTCFLGGTKVWVQETDKKGKPHIYSKPIEKIHAGEYVVTRQEQTGETRVQQVVRPTVRHTGLVLSLGLADAKSGKMVETITTTREHPFFVEGRGFVPAGGLAVGNAIVTRAGPCLVVKSIQWKRRSEGYTVYNLVVAQDHTYFVGNAHGGAWVHNPENCPTSINGRLPRNSKYAGKEFPLSDDLASKYPDGVTFTPDGFPDFSPYAKKSVEVDGLIGDEYEDFKLANQNAGYDNTPSGYTWHHHQDGKTMQLMPSDLHGGVPHTGGAAIIREKQLGERLRGGVVYSPWDVLK